MVGLSYPGISQLFVAATQPPHLAAIAPLSVIADTGRGTLRPGGILNDGFAPSLARGSRPAMPKPRPRAVRAGPAIASRRRRGVREQPDPARARPPTCCSRSPTTRTGTTSPRHSPRNCSSTRSRCRCSSPAPGRTSRPARTSPTCSTTSPAPTRRGSRSRTVGTPSRFDPAILVGGSSSCRSTSRRWCRNGRRSPHVDRAGHRRGSVGIAGHAAARSLRRTRRRSRPRARPSKPTRACASCSRTAPGANPASRTRGSRAASRAGRCRAPRHAPWYFDTGSALVDRAPPHRPR